MGPASGANVVAVATTRVALGSISKTFKIGGEVVAEDSVDTYADIAGKISSVRVEVGDAVRKGQIIATVDPSKPGSEYAESPVTAPISGTVTAVSVGIGNTVSSTTAIATIGRLDDLRVELHIPERFIGQIDLGTRASLSFSAWPDRDFTARVVEVSPVVDASSRTMKTTLSLDGEHSGVKAGMYATAVLIIERRERVLTVPSDCVVARDGKNVVYIVDQNRAVERPVELGLSAGGATEITQGLVLDQEVVESGQSLLSDGVEVKIVNSVQEGGAR